MGSSSAAHRARDLTFTHEATPTGAAFDYRAAASESREEAAAAESFVLSLITWTAAAGFAVWFFFWLASSLGRVVAQVVR